MPEYLRGKNKTHDNRARVDMSGARARGHSVAGDWRALRMQNVQIVRPPLCRLSVG